VVGELEGVGEWADRDRFRDGSGRQVDDVDEVGITGGDVQRPLVVGEDEFVGVVDGML
jgi:hypothetical protein